MIIKILYIWDADYPWDVRVDKICKTFIDNGYEIHIAARNLKKKSVYERLEGIHIHRLKPYSNDKINYFLSFPAFFSPIWKKFIDNIINKNGINLIIVRDLPISIAGIWAGKRNNIRVMFDMAEDYLAMLKDFWKYKRYEGLNIIIRNPYLAKYVEKYVFKNMNHILVVVEEAQNVVMSRGGSFEKTSIVSNTPSLKLFDNSPQNNIPYLNEIGKIFSVIYTGGVTKGRGIHTVLEAIPDIIKNIPSFLFVIVGDGYARPLLEDVITKLGIKKYVLWLGWVEHAKVYQYINACKVGLIPHFATEHTDTTIPNKLFDYMGFKLPVITSDAIPMKRILLEENCGLSYKSGDSKDLAKKMFEIYSTKTDFGGNGRKAIENKYNWETDTKRLLQAVKETI